MDAEARDIATRARPSRYAAKVVDMATEEVLPGAPTQVLFLEAIDGDVCFARENQGEWSWVSPDPEVLKWCRERGYEVRLVKVVVGEVGS